jgi:hypothetical protein
MSEYIWTISIYEAEVRAKRTSPALYFCRHLAYCRKLCPKEQYNSYKILTYFASKQYMTLLEKWSKYELEIH